MYAESIEKQLLRSLIRNVAHQLQGQINQMRLLTL